MLEVLVALALFAVTAAVLAQTCANILQSLHVVGGTRGDALVEGWAIRHILSIEDRETLERGGRLALPDDRSVTWRAEVEAGPLLDLMVVRLHMSYAERGGGRMLEEEGVHYLYRPQWMTVNERSAVFREREGHWLDWVRERDLPLR